MTRRVKAIGVLAAAALAGGTMTTAARAETSAAPTLKQSARVTPGRDTTPRPVAGEVAVRFRRGASSSTKANTARKANAEVGAAIPGTEFVTVRHHDRDADAAVARLEADPEVADATPIFERRAAALPNDQFWSTQAPILATQHLPEAWATSTGNGVTIAVLDSGVDPAHPDLSGRVLAGRDVVNNDANAADDNGHGTAVAGIAAAKAYDAVGMAGVAWNARILPVKVLDADGVGSDPDIAEGMVWATDHGAKIINMSLGGYGTSPVLDQAVAYALAHDVLVVAATGNDGVPVPSFPASSPGVVGVGATDAAGRLAFFSNWGDQVDVVAPGWGVVYPVAGSIDYAQGDGTSFSSPIVSGIAAMLRSAQPGLSQSAVAARLEDTATDSGPDGDDARYGGGIVNAWASLGGPVLDLPTPAGDLTGSDDFPDAARLLSSTLNATIAPEGDTDWYAFDAPAAGALAVTVTPTGVTTEIQPQEFDATLEVFDSGMLPLGAIDDNWALGSGEQLTVPVAAAGRHYIRVRNWLPTVWMGGYTVSAAFSPGSAPVPADVPLLLVLRSATPGNNASAPAGVSPVLRFTTNVAAASVAGAVAVARADDATATPATATLTAPDTITIDPTAAALKSGPYRIQVSGLTTPEGAAIPPVEVRFVVPPIGPWAPFASANALIAQQFVDVLTHAGDPAVITWLAGLQTGTPQPVAVAESFFATTEFVNVIAPLTRLYFAYFNRAPDYAGLKAWVINLRSGWTLKNVADSFVRSPEFIARYGALSNAGFVDLVYRNVLGRGPDATGLANWLSFLNTGRMSRGDVMLGFSESAEFKAKSRSRVDVSIAYVGMLRRTPTSVEQLGWIGGNAAGRSRQSLLGDLFNSRPYRTRFGQ